MVDEHISPHTSQIELELHSKPVGQKFPQYMIDSAATGRGRASEPAEIAVTIVALTNNFLVCSSSESK